MKTRDVRARRALIGLLVLIAAAAGCAGPVHGLYPPAPGEPVKPLHVVNHGWHTGIAVRREDIPEGVWPEHRDFGDSEYVEVGWGDRDFYMAPEGTLGLALKAVFWPTSSVLHIVGFDGPVERFFRNREIVEIRVSDRGFREFAAFVHDAYARDGGRPIALGPGDFANSRFYLAREKYFLLKTCNTWTARALRAAGLPIAPLSAVTAADLMRQARRFGEVLQHSHASRAWSVSAGSAAGRAVTRASGAAARPRNSPRERPTSAWRSGQTNTSSRTPRRTSTASGATSPVHPAIASQPRAGDSSPSVCRRRPAVRPNYADLAPPPSWRLCLSHPGPASRRRPALTTGRSARARPPGQGRDDEPARGRFAAAVRGRYSPACRGGDPDADIFGARRRSTPRG